MNRLAGETSPYLRQHRDNPVDWFPWGDEAFAVAQQTDRPILLSIGYSACHWCHVMAHESFEDPAVAAIMNARFVNVKVDREERPDVDAIYMEAVQAITGHGGWPMTVFLTPNGKPFFGGTYFPPTRRGNTPSFVELCEAVTAHWQDHRGDAVDQSEKLTEAIGQLSFLAKDPATKLPPSGWLPAAVTALLSGHDDRYGGFGGAPKFPHSMSLELLLRHYVSTGDPLSLTAARTSLDAMASGGMYDHLGGGFARYSTDTYWLVPHFEKMLYDNALLIRPYLHAWQLTGEPQYRQVVVETIEYVLRDLGLGVGVGVGPGAPSPAAFASAEDADSEGEEGVFYVWRTAEVAATGGPECVEWYGVTDAGNFEGSNILNRLHAPGDLIRPAAVQAGRDRLLAARAKRPRPGLDDKVLTEWNALFIGSLAEAAGVLARADWQDIAVRASEFMLDNLRRPDGRWLRSWQAEGGARHLAYASDYAALVEMFIRLAELTGQARWIASARDVADEMLRLFWDDGVGGLFTTGRDADALIARTKDVMDNATPAANNLAALALLRLAVLTGHEPYKAASERIVQLLAPIAVQHPGAFGVALAALDLLTEGVDEIVIAGERPDLVDVVRRQYRPRAVLAWGEQFPSPLWEGRPDAAAYVCRNYTCGLPATTAAQLANQLGDIGYLAPHPGV